MTIETKFAVWVNTLLNPQKPHRVKENIMHDGLVARLERVERLREYARQYASQSNDTSKLMQANRLMTAITERLNARYHHSNTFNFN